MPSIVVSQKQYEQLKRDKKWRKVSSPLGKNKFKNPLFKKGMGSLLKSLLK